MSAPRFAASADALLTPADLATMSGLAFIQGIRDGTLPHPPICATLGFRLSEAEAGRVVFEGRPGFESYNPLGAVHGGWFGAVLDSCMACAVQTTLAQGRGYTTLEYGVSILRPAFEDGPLLRATGEVVSSGRRVATARGTMVDEAGRTVATGTTTCLVFDL